MTTALRGPDVMPLLLEACPSFRSRWNEHIAWSGYEPLLHVDIAEFADHLGHAADLRGAIRSAFSEVPDIDMYGLGFMLHYRLAESHMQAGENAAATREFELALANATRCTDRLPWLYFHLARLAKGAGDESRLRWAVGAAASADSLAGGHSGVPALTRGLLAATGGS